jgi:peptidoglycan L-alanyl-D-glutamate endopeptidase CwlK
MGLDLKSSRRLVKAHPLLQELFEEVAKKVEIKILESQRGEADQELAVKLGRSKAHFGQSAHNWTPAIALDVVPLPIDWKNTKAFVALGQKVILPLAKKLKIPVRWGADWNMNSKLSDESFVDMPHWELHPWREFAKKAKLFKG